MRVTCGNCEIGLSHKTVGICITIRFENKADHNARHRRTGHDPQHPQPAHTQPQRLQTARRV